MSKLPFDVAREAMTALEFFQVPYAGGLEYQTIHMHALHAIRNAASNAKRSGGNNSNNDYKFLMMFADALEQSNKPGEYADTFGAKAVLERLGLAS